MPCKALWELIKLIYDTYAYVPLIFETVTISHSLNSFFLNFTQFVIEQCDLPTKSNQGVLDIACQRDWLTFKNITGSIKSDKNLVNYTEIG